MKLRKILCATLALGMIVSTVPTNVTAAETQDVAHYEVSEDVVGAATADVPIAEFEKISPDLKDNLLFAINVCYTVEEGLRLHRQ